MVRCKSLHDEITKFAEESSSEVRETIGTSSASHCILKVEGTIPEAFSLLLEFIYTGFIQNVRDFEIKIILDLYLLALKYGIKKLFRE